VTRGISAIVVNFNSAGHLERCLTALTASLEGLPSEAVVVDNASTDGSPAGADAFGPRVTLHRQPTNRGFAAAANTGLALTTREYALILNPDVMLSRDTVRTLMAELDAHPECGLAGPRLFDPDGRVQGSARGDPNMLTGLFGRATLLTRLFPRLRIVRRNVVSDFGRDGDRAEVDWVSGACMLGRRTALEAVGGFDERFFLYWEDADLCRRLRNRGFTIRYVPHATATHTTGVSSRRAGPLTIRAFHASAFTYYVTHVATARVSPARSLARVLLAIRCRWKLLMDRLYARRNTTRSWNDPI
jgi:GT2 family glycosyltransferase